MNLENININNKLLVFIIFIIFYSIFNLYLKHEVSNDTSISEWLINYRGGFTRRGLGGEINILISNLLNIELRKAILFFQIFVHTSFLILIFFYLKKLRLDIFQFFALFAPIFLLYPIAELEVLGRKEMLVFLFFSINLYLANKKFHPRIINIFTFITLPILCFIWEPVIFFIPFFSVILIFKNKYKTFYETLNKLSIIFSSSILTIIIIFLNPLSGENHQIMCNFLVNNFDETCYMSANLLIKNTIYFDTLFIYERTSWVHFLRYFLIFFIGFFPFHLNISNNKFTNQENFISLNFKPLYLYAVLYVPVLMLFAFGHDWGRWINITYTLSILSYFYLLKNNYISNHFNYRSKLAKIFKKSKKTLYVSFFIFAFFWNPKTLITGDIATNSLYKIIYKSTKVIFKLDSTRLFQNNLLIKFHRKYIE